ncbi:MAG: thioredoxin family protein [Proteobacteria bacterium]|nr:thioredoxin family protein [Pseudomonadota bacterium]
MKTIAQIIAVFLALAAAQPALAAVAVGRPAPDFTLTDTHEHDHSLSQYLGKTVVLEWTNHECPYVRKHYDSGSMQMLQKEETEKGIVWLSIVSSAPGEQGHTAPEEANKIMGEEKTAETARLLDPSGDTGRLYGAKTTPHMFIINPEGLLVYAGAIDDRPSARMNTLQGARNHVRAALAEMAEGKPVSTPQTKPYGCSVKYAR